jgi:2-aminoadipate transaminase
MSTPVETGRWAQALSQRALSRGDAELSTILAGTPPGVLSLTGGFPNPETFPTDVLDEIVSRLVRDDPAVALQYAPSEGIPSVREYLVDRQEQLQGHRPELAELIVTSGGMECIGLAAQSVVDPGDAVVVEAPTYLGALMAFAGFEADLVGIPMDADGMQVEALEERLAAGPRPKLVYVIPEYQNPSGRTLSLERRHALVEVCRRHGVLVLEDVAYREISFDGSALPSLWSLAPDVVVQAGTFSKTLCPGVRLGWAVGPREVIAQMAAAKQTTDQCAGALGQRLVEAYGRAGHFERRLPEARALYASHWRAVERPLSGARLPPGCTWSEPTGGFFTWLTLPPAVDTVALRPAALAAGVAYVPGRPFHVGGDGHNELRVSFSFLPEVDLLVAVERLAAVVRHAV